MNSMRAKRRVVILGCAPSRMRWHGTRVFWSILFTLGLSACSSVAAGKVGLAETSTSYTLSNDVVTARVDKRSGDLVSLRYRGLELLGRGSGHPFGYWSHGPLRGAPVKCAVTIDPGKNGGERAEVSVKGFYVPGATNAAAVACDVEIRYALGRDDSGVYTYSIFTHPFNYPAASIGEARFGAKLNADVFDYMTIDEKRRKVMPRPEDWTQGTRLNMSEVRRLNTGVYKGHAEHKYAYSAIQFETPACGWSSTRHRVGLWFVNPTIEYLSGGATKVELTGHLDSNEGGAPTLLNYWRGSHYGGAVCEIGEREEWTKVIGPFLIYCNSGGDHEALWKDALAQAAVESRRWPYDWVQGVDYPHRAERATVKGEVVLNDPQAPRARISNLLVGLTAPDYMTPEMPSGGGRNARSRPRRLVDWQTDAKYYQFWVRGDERGRFTIPNVRPGTYMLHAIADGVLGEAVVANVTVSAGQTLNLGRLQWTPLRFGRQVWEIGIPDRSAAEFRHGDHYWQWGLYFRYPEEFPNDVTFVIGQSDPRIDWNYAQVPRGTNAGSVWSVVFELPEAPRGCATLRMGIAGITLREGVNITVNGRPAGGTGPMADTATIRRDGIRGYWSERNVAFDASLLRRGTNIIGLIVPPGGPTTGVMYDYLRLELDESGTVSDLAGNVGQALYETVTHETQPLESH